MSNGFLRGLAFLILGFWFSVNAAAQIPASLKGFPTAEAAAEALTDAIRREDDKAVAAILGSSWHDFLPGSNQDDDEVRAKFLKAWDESHKIVLEGDGKALVAVGTTGWISPVPIVKQGGEWRYDVKAGEQEIQARLIGRNELFVIQTLLAIVDAQRDYVSLDPTKAGVPVYARRLLSTPGHKDGLYWESKPGEPESPLGPLVAKAQPGELNAEDYHGYRFRLLYRQGPDAPGGAYDYLVNGRMIGGFAVLAWPVKYDETGVMTFMVSHSGDVYEQDLGPSTSERAAAIASFNPDKEWEKADMAP
jgi:Protein of unknown function (DUF2950)